MDFCIKEYIDNNLPLHAKAVYNIPTWKASTLSAGLPTVAIPVNKNENVHFILVQQLLLSRPNNAMNLFDLKRPTVPVLSLTNQVSFPICAPFIYIVKDDSLTLQMDNPIANNSFSIMYQTITITKK